MPQVPARDPVASSCASADPGNVRHLFREARSTPLAHPAELPIAELTSVSVGPAGAIAVTDAKDYNVKLFDKHGRYTLALGRRGDGPGEFRSPATAAFLNDSLIVTVDRFQGRLSVFTSRGAFVGSSFLSGIRSVGRIEPVQGAFLISGLGPWRGRDWRDSLWLVHRTDTTGTITQYFGKLPASYTQYAVLTSGPIYVAMSGPHDSTLFVTGRLLADIWKFDVAGRLIESTAITRTQWFVDPREALARLKGDVIRNFVSHVSPIMGLVASRRSVLVGYYSPASGDKRLRWDVYDRNLNVAATGMLGPLFVTARGDTLVAVEGMPANQGLDVRYRLSWYVPC
jgi:hypothetical protein